MVSEKPIRCAVSVFFLFNVLLVAGCVPCGLRPDVSPQSVHLVQGVVLGYNDTDCFNTPVETDENAATSEFIASFLGGAVTQGVDAIANWIEKRREERRASYGATFTARGFGELHDRKGHLQLKCVMIYRGARGEASTITEDWPKERLEKLSLATPPDFFLELSVATDEKATAFRLYPQRLEYRKTAAKRSRGVKDLMVAGIVESPYRVALSDKSTVGVFNISFPGLPEGRSKERPDGTVLDKKDMSNLSSQWIPIPPAFKEADKDLTSMAPVSVLVTVEEAEEGSDLMLGFLEALSAAARDSKDTISDQISASIVERLGLSKESEGDGEQ